MMYVLLINANPVVSRLLALCTRNSEMVLEEVEDITLAKRKYYDIVFVDEESYTDEVLHLEEYIDTNKKVFFSSENVGINTFDMTIKKPFLPAQIITLLEEIDVKEAKEAIDTEDIENDKVSIFPLASEEVEKEVEVEPKVLDTVEIEKIKVLLDMDDEVDTTEVLSEEEIEVRKIELIKEQLISDGLEIIEEDELLEELEVKDTIKIFEDDELPQVKSTKKIKSNKKKKKKKTLKYTEHELEKIEDAIQMAIVTLKRKQMKKLLKGKKIDVTVQIKGAE